MYILIDEDGEISKAEELTEEHLQIADSGILDIISISGSQPTQYHDGKWYGINIYGE